MHRAAYPRACVSVGMYWGRSHKGEGSGGGEGAWGGGVGAGGGGRGVEAGGRTVERGAVKAGEGGKEWFVWGIRWGRGAGVG